MLVVILACEVVVDVVTDVGSIVFVLVLLCLIMVRVGVFMLNLLFGIVVPP